MATASRRGADPSRSAARILRCEGCGAAVAFSAEVGAPRCAFCAAVMRLEQPSDPIEIAERVLPFGVPAEAARGALRAWLASLGFFRPSDLAASSTLEQLRAIHWCCWLVDADALVSWSADSDAGSGLSAWAPHAGQTAMTFQRLVIPASRGLSLRECARLSAHYDVGHLVEAQDAPGGALIEQFDVQRSAARSIVVDAIERTAAARLVDRHIIPGSRSRNVRVAILLRALQTERVALCAYVLAYRYKGRSYRAIVHGQNAAVTFGEAPYSIAKIVMTAATAIIGVTAIVAIIILLGG